MITKNHCLISVERYRQASLIIGTLSRSGATKTGKTWKLGVNQVIDRCTGNLAFTRNPSHAAITYANFQRGKWREVVCCIVCLLANWNGCDESHKRGFPSSNHCYYY